MNILIANQDNYLPSSSKAKLQQLENDQTILQLNTPHANCNGDKIENNVFYLPIPSVVSSTSGSGNENSTNN